MKSEVWTMEMLNLDNTAGPHCRYFGYDAIHDHDIHLPAAIIFAISPKMYARPLSNFNRVHILKV
ncbi:hypothetical protein DL346_22470 [Paenibacillus montanisoli]|uniref:Uncharacterized protein n=1 Tax=Paenibacillus montanisoli TaxID=2081970 RepID=A0A328U1N7_9BACL|nr:hypothetical protein DL346_22470 [Paenibacillus montanisoli]